MQWKNSESGSDKIFILTILSKNKFMKIVKGIQLVLQLESYKNGCKFLNLKASQ